MVAGGSIAVPRNDELHFIISGAIDPDRSNHAGMASLSSSSTMAQVEAAYDDNASYAEDDSITKAKAFVTAVRFLLRRLYSSEAFGSASLSTRVDLLRDELRDAQKWLEARDVDSLPSPRVTRANFQNFR